MGILPYLVFILLMIIVFITISKIADHALEVSDLKDFALNITGTFIVKVALDNKILDVNDTFVKYTNYEKNEVINKISFSDLVTKISDLNYKEFLAKLYGKGISESEIRIFTKDNKEILVNIFAKAFKDKTGKLYYVFVCKDISDFYIEGYDDENENMEGRILFRELAESETIINKNFSFYPEELEKIKESENRHKFIVESMNIGVFEYDIIRNTYYFSEKCRDILGISKELSDEEFKNEFVQNIHKDDYSKLLKSLHFAVSNKSDSFKSVFRFMGEKDSCIWIEFLGKLSYDASGDIIFLSGSLSDISSACIYQEKIKKLAYYDTLTGLYNRTYMQESIDLIFKSNEDSKSALIFLDIDDFKFINDSFGHYFGDKVICEMADRIKKISLKEYIVSRFSGDEIAIFIPDYGDYDKLISFINLLFETLKVNYNDKEISYSVAASVGIALSPEHGTSFESLMKSADIAMNQAKATGKNKYLIFNQEMHKDFKDRLSLEKDLKEAIFKNKDLYLYLQPQFEISTGRLSGFESLTRWISDKRGSVSPAVFIPIAEETRLIVPLGKWVFLESCKVLKLLQDNGFNDVKISVNVSPIQLLDNDFMDSIREIIETTGVNTNKLEVEITETALMENFDSNIEKIWELRNLGISIALDDFGTGYSSLTYLKTIPMSSIKIDKSFIDNISTSDIDKKITQKIIDLSHVLQFKTIAEGVETREQLEFVQSIGCDIVQGYFGGRPIDKGDVFKVLNNNLNDYF